MVGSLLAGKINPFQQERVKKKECSCLYPQRGYFGFVSSNKRGVFCHKNKKIMQSLGSASSHINSL
jgi:hypothetical protein